METGETSDLWWKNAIIYCVDVETYRDANGDGIGDFAGLTVTAMRSLPPHPVSAQWATFVRNHDELSLDKLTDAIVSGTDLNEVRTRYLASMR